MEIHTRLFGENPKVSIVIPVADIEDNITRQCVEHLEKTLTIPFKLILAESSGTDFSYGRSMNAGIRTAPDFDFIFGMDSDAYPFPGTIEAMMSYATSDPRLGYIGAKITQCNGKAANIGWVHQNIWWYSFNSIRNMAPLSALRRIMMGKWWSFSVRVPPYYIPGKMTGIITTLFLIRRRCYEDVGPFDEDFRYSFVDVDYAFRVLTSSWYISVCPKADVLHKGHATASQQLQRAEFRGWERYLEKWTKERIKEVKAAARNNKFIIPNGVSQD